MKASGRILAVTFDVGGTLIEPWPSVGHVYAQVAFEHGEPGADPELLNRRFAAAWKARSEGAEFNYSRASWSKLVSRTFRGMTAQVEEIKFFGALYDRFSRAEAWRIHDDVIPTLDALLTRGIKLALISNWDERLRPLMGRLRLDRYFDFMAISGEIGFHKPSSVIFNEAARKMGCPAENILHVGDSREEDLNGATGAGMRALHVNRTKAEVGPDTIRSLREIESWIE